MSVWRQRGQVPVLFKVAWSWHLALATLALQQCEGSFTWSIMSFLDITQQMQLFWDPKVENVFEVFVGVTVHVAVCCAVLVVGVGPGWDHDSDSDRFKLEFQHVVYLQRFWATSRL
jgi:hypothetical protein